MTIQWYPGHMTKARRVIADAMPTQDLVLEVLDARMPLASANPVFTELRRGKPCIKLLNKSDLADPEVTRAWLEHFDNTSGPTPEGGRTVAAALNSKKPANTAALLAELCKRLDVHKGARGRAVRAIILGIPNVGKSTLLNMLMERKVAKTGDEPAVTKNMQLVELKNGMVVTDHPGLMWPKNESEEGSYCLAFGGAIPDTALDFESVALFGARVLLERYPELLRARYKLPALPASADALLDELGRRRGCLRPGGIVDRYKVSELLVHEFRAGSIGRCTLEAPPALR